MKTTNQDPWKELIDKNKDSFNQRKPKNLWTAIEEELEPVLKKKTKLIPLFKVYRIAALFVISLGVGYFLMYSHFTSKNDLTGQQQVEVEETEELNLPAEFIEAEHYYASQFDEKTTDLITFLDDKEIIEELNLLRKEFEELRKEAGDNINDERIVEAMIQNYR